MRPTTHMNPLSNLTWHKLSVTLLNIRSIQMMHSHPFSVMEAIVKGTSALTDGRTDSNVFFRIKDRNHSFSIRKTVRIPLEILFVGKAPGYAECWRKALQEYLSDPAGGKNFEIFELGEIEERSYEAIASEILPVEDEGEMCLEFLSPFPFEIPGRKQRTSLSEAVFVDALQNRFSRLFGTSIKYESDRDDFEVLPYYWNYTQKRHISKSQPGQTQFINGCVGKLYVKGVFKDLLPFLILGSELHAGTKISNSQGYYRLRTDSPSFFDEQLFNKPMLRTVIRDAIDKYDADFESLPANDKLLFDDESVCTDITDQIQSDAYDPVPNRAFSLKKPDGSNRVVEKLHPTDLIVQEFLLKLLTPVIDRALEKESIGFRKGVSREIAAERIRDALIDGYRFVIESDIDDFFPSIDLDRLEALIDFYLPQADRRMRILISKSVRNGYELNGKIHERHRGLAQGSPLSPLLANLYLDSFDEYIQQWDCRMIRYADDFVILTRTRKDAERLLIDTESFLDPLGLKLNRAKTAIAEADEGFEFLGIRFDKDEIVIEPEEISKKLKKPLYITEPYGFLSLNGDAIDVRKNNSVIDTIPLRRISEIMVMEKTTFSTALIAKCIDFGIPFTITLSTGYYITTIKPDSKLQYGISGQHTAKYVSLSDLDILVIAKEFAAGKLNNYISLFRQRYVGGQNQFIGRLEDTIQRIYRAGNIFEVRGLEGAAAKDVYRQLNIHIDNEAFKIRKRSRRKPDPINSMLNFGYYLLFSRVNATVRAAGLNPYLGFLHSPNDNYESLVCDIEELFRSRIDRFIIRLINLGTIKEDDFVKTDRGWFLTRDAVKKYLSHFETEMDKKPTRHGLSLKQSIYAQVVIVKEWALEKATLTFYRWKV